MKTRTHYGHKMLELSDFGGWACRACGRGGDEQTKPQDYECTSDSRGKECICEWDEWWSAAQPSTVPEITYIARDCPIHGDSLDGEQ